MPIERKVGDETVEIIEAGRLLGAGDPGLVFRCLEAIIGECLVERGV